MAKPFKSEFSGNKALEAALDFDSKNIWEGNNRVGGHVGLIHKALNAWREGEGGKMPDGTPLPVISGSELARNEYGRTTSALVIAYKTVKGIRNYKGEFDPIVGKKTVSALDDELPVKPKTNGDRNGDGNKTATRVLDVVVQFHGIPPADPRAGLETQDDVFGNMAAFNEAAKKHGKARDLAIVNMYGKPGTSAVDEAVKVFDEKTKGRKLGMLIVVGSSIGGKNASDFIDRKKSLKLTYAAFLDAAFDSPSDPFLRRAIVADDADSVFQTMTFTWADLLGTPEFHGAIAGTKPKDVTNSVNSGAENKTTQESIDQLRGKWTMPRILKFHLARISEKRVHDRAVKDGWAHAGPKIIGIIENAPAPAPAP